MIVCARYWACNNYHTHHLVTVVSCSCTCLYSTVDMDEFSFLKVRESSGDEM